jgi:uncharacterized protein (TIGR02597 family)
MNIPQKTLSLLVVASLLSFSSLTAVETDPVGYITKTVNANSDLKLGLPLQQAPVLSSSVDSVVTSTVTVSATVPDVTTSVHYLWVTSGTLLGNWYTVTGSTSNSVSVAEDLADEGLTSTDTFQIVPFWTLDTLFPSGGGVPQSSDVFAASGQVQLSNLSGTGINISTGSAYMYSDGSQIGIYGIAEGWLDVNNPFGGAQGSVLVTPASYITIRNSTGSSSDIVNVGNVPTVTLANNVLSSSSGAQDSQISNPFPAAVQLGSSGLIEDGVVRGSSDVFAPLDQLQIYPASPSGINPSTSSSYIYSDGSQLGIYGIPEGWLDVNNPFGGTKNTDEIPAGAAIIVRRAAGTDELVSWSPSTPYTLD